MSTPDLKEIFARAQEMQSRLASAQRELATRTVSASSGGGMVTAVATGQLRVVSVEIDPALLAGGDRAMIQDLVAAAVNAALAEAQRVMQEELQRAAGPLPFPLPGGFPGSGAR